VRTEPGLGAGCGKRPVADGAGGALWAWKRPVLDAVAGALAAGNRPVPGGAETRFDGVGETGGSLTDPDAFAGATWARGMPPDGVVAIWLLGMLLEGVATATRPMPEFVPCEPGGSLTDPTPDGCGGALFPAPRRISPERRWPRIVLRSRAQFRQERRPS
jgi:hypothetical protein